MFFCLNIRRNWPQSEHAYNGPCDELEIRIADLNLQQQTIEKMKNSLKLLAALGLAALLTGCGDSSSSTDVQTPDPATQPQEQAILFERTIGRAQSLIEAKQYKMAQESVDLLKTYKLTPEQQAMVDKIQAQIPKTQ
jgi:hypothetical protein